MDRIRRKSSQSNGMTFVVVDLLTPVNFYQFIALYLNLDEGPLKLSPNLIKPCAALLVL